MLPKRAQKHPDKKIFRHVAPTSHRNDFEEKKTVSIMSLCETPWFYVVYLWLQPPCRLLISHLVDQVAQVFPPPGYAFSGELTSLQRGWAAVRAGAGERSGWRWRPQRGRQTDRLTCSYNRTSRTWSAGESGSILRDGAQVGVTTPKHRQFFYHSGSTTNVHSNGWGA